MKTIIEMVATVVVLLGWCAWRIQAQGLSWATARRWSFYIPISLLAIGVFLGFFFYAAHIGISDELTAKWVNVFMTALFVFGFAIKKFWQYRRRWTFWAELSVLVVAHFIFLQRLNWQKESYFWLAIVIGIPEMFITFILLALMFKPERLPSQGSSKHDRVVE
jgi:hypothetical protein